MIPAAPLVGAVTTRPPAAFSSLTARAKRFTQSIAPSRSLDPSPNFNFSYMRAARRPTFNPPGSSPSVLRPRAMQASIAAQISSSLARVSLSLRKAPSLAKVISLIDFPCSWQCRSSVSPR